MPASAPSGATQSDPIDRRTLGFPRRHRGPLDRGREATAPQGPNGGASNPSPCSLRSVSLPRTMSDVQWCAPPPSPPERGGSIAFGRKVLCPSDPLLSVWSSLSSCTELRACEWHGLALPSTGKYPPPLRYADAADAALASFLKQTPAALKLYHDAAARRRGWGRRHTCGARTRSRLWVGFRRASRTGVRRRGDVRSGGSVCSDLSNPPPYLEQWRPTMQPSGRTTEIDAD